MTYKFKSPFGEEYLLKVLITDNAITLSDSADGFPFAKASTYLPGLEKGEYAIKDYSENQGILNFLLENNIVEPPHRFGKSGYVTIPVCRLKNSPTNNE